MACFLIDASLPRLPAELTALADHQFLDVRDLGLGSAPDADVAHEAQRRGCIVMTRDFDFANVLDYPPQRYSGILVIEAHPRAGREEVLSLIQVAILDADLIAAMPQRLAIVSRSRVRVRPPL